MATLINDPNYTHTHTLYIYSQTPLFMCRYDFHAVEPIGDSGVDKRGDNEVVEGGSALRRFGIRG